MNLIDALRQQVSYCQSFDAGLYEIHYQFRAPGFDPDSMTFDWQGQKTGPWDYAPSGPRNGECLLPTVRLTTSAGAEVKARVFIPRRPELDAGNFHGRVGFRVKDAGPLSLELGASIPVEWTRAEIVPVTDFQDTTLSASDIDTPGRFLLSDEQLTDLKANWGKAVWCQHLDRILDDCARFTPPTTQADAKIVATEFLRTRAVYEDNVVFWGNYLAGLSLRLLALARDEDLAQLKRWIDALISLDYWGDADDPHGRNHNNDLTADFNMFGLVLALNWHAPRLGNDRVICIQKRIHHQGREMLKWIVGSRSSWPGTRTQNHAYFGYQTVLLAGAALLGAGESYEAEALDWLRIGAAASKRFCEHLPSDGSFHEGLGYIAFGMYGLMPSLLLLEQLTGRPWVPWKWLAAHMEAVDTLLPRDALEGFWIDDGDAYLPCNIPLTLWVWQHAPEAATRDTAARILAKVWDLPEELTTQPNRIIGCFWRLLLTPELTDLPAPAPPAEGWRHRLLPAAGCCVFRPTGDSRLYFLSGPPHGHELFRREQHIYSYGHHHPDMGNILLHDRGTWVLADTGYTFRKCSGEHNVLLINGQGQHNDSHVWMVPPPWEIQPERVQMNATESGVQAGLDLASAYPVKLGLISWNRTVSVTDSGFAVMDEMHSRVPVIFTLSWVSSQAWRRQDDGCYHLPRDWRLSVDGEVRATSEPIVQARRFGGWLTAPTWEALRLSNPQPLTRYRLISVFTHASARTDPVALLAAGEGRT
jgi:hypothetical protein